MGAERKNNTPHFAVYSHVLLSALIVIARDLCYCCNCCNALFFFLQDAVICIFNMHSSPAFTGHDKGQLQSTRREKNTKNSSTLLRS